MSLLQDKPGVKMCHICILCDIVDAEELQCHRILFCGKGDGGGKKSSKETWNHPWISNLTGANPTKAGAHCWGIRQMEEYAANHEGEDSRIQGFGSVFTSEGNY